MRNIIYIEVMMYRQSEWIFQSWKLWSGRNELVIWLCKRQSKYSLHFLSSACIQLLILGSRLNLFLWKIKCLLSVSFIQELLANALLPVFYFCFVMQEIRVGDHNGPARFKIWIEMNKSDIIMEVLIKKKTWKVKKCEFKLRTAQHSMSEHLTLLYPSYFFL